MLRNDLKDAVSAGNVHCLGRRFDDSDESSLVCASDQALSLSLSLSLHMSVLVRAHAHAHVPVQGLQHAVPQAWNRPVPPVA